jgi:uncharacterized membrane protein
MARDAFFGGATWRPGLISSLGVVDIFDLSLVARLHLAVTAYMAGLIWFVQVVHYPLLAFVGPAEFARYEQRNTRITAWVVAPAMLAEFGLAVALAVLNPGFLTWAGLGLLAVIWVSTWLLQVPAHRRLEKGFDGAVHERLVRSNWVRTAAWSMRVGIAVALLGTTPV